MPDRSSEVIQQVSPREERLDARLTTPEEDINALREKAEMKSQDFEKFQSDPHPTK